jgi:hypothetical protein
MLASCRRMLGRSWLLMVAKTGTNTLGFWVWTVALTIMGCLASVGGNYWHLRLQLIPHPLTQAIEDSWFASALVVGGGAVLVALAWSASTIYLIYLEHKGLEKEIEHLHKQRLLSDAQDKVLRLTRGVRSFMAEHRGHPDEESKEFSAWLAKFHAEYQERFADSLREASIGLKKLGIGEAQMLEGWANVGPNLPEGCITLIGPLLEFLMRSECQARDGREEFIYEFRWENEKPLFAPLQIEAFKLAKELRDFYASLGPYPSDPTQNSDEDTPRYLVRFYEDRIEKRGAWQQHLSDGFANRQLGRKITALIHRVGEEYQLQYPAQLLSRVVEIAPPLSSEGIPQIAQEMEMIAIWIGRKQRNEVNLIS